MWPTGLPSAGKTTQAQALARRLRADGLDVEGAGRRRGGVYLSAGLGFSRADRAIHVDRMGFVAELLARHGMVLVPVIAPYAAARDKVRHHHRAPGCATAARARGTPIKTCVKRDVKGLQCSAFRGEISSMTGVDNHYEVPVEPDLGINTGGVYQDSAVDLLMKMLSRTGVLR